MSVLRMAAPLVVSFWMRAAVTFVDTIYASFLGDVEVAAVGLTIPFEFLMTAFWVGLSTGLTSEFSRAMGCREHGRVEQALRVGWRFVLAFAPLFTLIGGAIWLAAPHLDLDPAVRDSFQLYGTVLVGGSAFTLFWSVIPDSLVKAHQDTRSTMWAGIWTNVINLGLNTLFLFVFHWGVFGIALSTVLGRLGGLVYALGRAGHHERIRRAAAAQLPPLPLPPLPYRAVLGLAIPSSLTFSLMAFESALINTLLARLPDATEAIAAYSIYYRLVLFALQPVIATSVAMLPFAALRAGAGEFASIRRGLDQANLAAAGYALAVVAPVLLPSAPSIAARLCDSPLAAAYATSAIRAVPLACLVGAPFLLCRPAFEALGRGRPGLFIAGLRYLLLTAPLALLGGRIAAALGEPRLSGLIAGTLASAAIASAVLHLWARAALRRLARPRAPARSASGRP